MGWFLFQTLLASGPEPAPFSFNERGTLLAPDFATRRGFAVCRVEAVVGPAGAGFSPGRAMGVDTADFARKFFVTETDLNEAGFLTELVRRWPSGLLAWSTLPGRLISVSEPPLASPTACCDSAVECSPASPFARCSFVSFGVASGCAWPLVAVAEAYDCQR